MNTSSSRRCQFPNWLIAAMFILCAMLLLTSCSKKASTAIIGKWQVQGSKERVEFRKDGTVITSQDITAGPPGSTRSIEQETTGKYTFTDGSHMNLQINTGDTNQPAISVSCEVQIHGNKMNMTMTAPGERQQHKANFKRLE
jgi:major membrane immunogen (membrane-anchored lipoprotein)